MVEQNQDPKRNHDSLMLNILLAIFKVRQQPNPQSQITVRLPIESKVGEQPDDFYTCMICIGDVVWNAKCCRGEQGCERLFCGSCIDKWLETKNDCPNCR